MPRALSPTRLGLNPANCAFGVTSGTLLGHIVSEEGIAVDPGKINAIIKSPTPKNAKALGQLRWHRHATTSSRFHDTLACRGTSHTISVDRHEEQGIRSLKIHAHASPCRPTAGLDAAFPRLRGRLKYSDWKRAHATHCAQLVSTCVLL